VPNQSNSGVWSASSAVVGVRSVDRHGDPAPRCQPLKAPFFKREGRMLPIRRAAQSSRTGLRVCSDHIPTTGTAASRRPIKVSMYRPY